MPVTVVVYTTFCTPAGNELVLIAGGGGAINKVSVFETETGGVAESITVTTTGFAPTAVGVPEIMPVPEAMIKPAGKPVADQL